MEVSTRPLSRRTWSVFQLDRIWKHRVEDYRLICKIEGERLLILVDIERLMSSPDMGLLERAAA